MRIKTTAPTLKDLNNEQLEQIAQIVMTQDLVAELKKQVDIAGVNWNDKRKPFLNDTKSPHTSRAYGTALDKLEVWARRENINPLEITTDMADQFIRELKAQGKASASIRRDIAAVSAFYTFLERYHSAIKNPVRGTRIRPPKENKKKKQLFQPS